MPPYQQGYFDCLCGIYSIVNAYSLLTGASVEDCQKMFNDIFKYLPKRTTTDGVLHSDVKRIAKKFFQFAEFETDKRGFLSIDEWWEYSREFLSHPKRAIIASVVDPKVWIKPVGHLTIISRMTEKTIYLHDSSKRTKWMKRECSIDPNADKSMIRIYPTQCWYLCIEEK